MILFWCFGLGCFCLGKILVCFQHDFGNKVGLLLIGCLWSEISDHWEAHLSEAQQMELANESQLRFKGKSGLGQKLQATATQSIKAILGWKFWIQDLFHEPEVLPVSLSHLVARMGWAHAKGPKGTVPYLLNHTSSISPISHMGLGHI